MSLYKAFKTDESVETKGVWIEYDTQGDGKPARFKIARAGGSNRKYTAVLERKMKPVRRALATGALDDKVSERILAETYAEAVILGWENITWPDGNGAEKALSFSRENCVMVLLALPELFADLQLQANRVAPFRDALGDREADSGNS